MANIENVKLAIQVMEQATNLNMEYWQNPVNGKFVNSINDLHACGNTACFAGYLAISGIPGWGTLPGRQPLYGKYADCEAVQHFLQVSPELAYSLVYGLHPTNDCGEFYPVSYSKVTPQHVIEKLNLILTGELQ